MLGFDPVGHIKPMPRASNHSPHTRTYSIDGSRQVREGEESGSNRAKSRTIRTTSPLCKSVPATIPLRIENPRKIGFRVRPATGTSNDMSPKTPQPRRFRALLPVFLSATVAALAADTSPVRPLDTNGKPLNLNFETGDLSQWTADGNAFEGQPIKGDTVVARRPDMPSRHTGSYWIGTYERFADARQGVLISIPFKVTHPWASFRVAGGSSPDTRVEIVAISASDKDNATSESVIFKASGTDHESLRPVVVDLSKQLGQSIRIRIVDKSSDRKSVV